MIRFLILCKTLSPNGNSKRQHTELARLSVSIHLSTGKISAPLKASGTVSVFRRTGDAVGSASRHRSRPGHRWSALCSRTLVPGGRGAQRPVVQSIHSKVVVHKADWCKILELDGTGSVLSEKIIAVLVVSPETQLLFHRTENRLIT